MLAIIFSIFDLPSAKRAALGTQDSKNSHVPTIITHLAAVAGAWRAIRR